MERIADDPSSFPGGAKVGSIVGPKIAGSGVSRVRPSKHRCHGNSKGAADARGSAISFPTSRAGRTAVCSCYRVLG